MAGLTNRPWTKNGRGTSIIIEFIRRCDRILTFFFLSLSDSRLLGKKTFDQALLKSVDYQFCFHVSKNEFWVEYGETGGGVYGGME